MRAFRSLHRSILVLFLVVVVAIVALVHFTISNMVAEQSRAQQQSLTPAFTLIAEEILKPLHIAQALSQSQELLALMEAPELDKTRTLAMLSRLEQEFDLRFFVASERARQQYLSDGQSIALIEGQVNWYFKYKNRPQRVVADIGKWEDTHIYMDLKIFDANGEFLGFFGVGQSLSRFLEVFESYKHEYGYDFFIVDQHDNIMLSSDASLVARHSQFTHLTELSWFSALPEEAQAQRDLNNQLIDMHNETFLVAEVGLDQFDWTVYLLSPLDKRQTAISKGFIASVLVLLAVVFALFFVIYHLLYYFRKNLHADVVLPHAARLPDRNQTEQAYNKILDNHHSVSVVVIDIDHFAMLADTYGRATADDIQQHVINFLHSRLREVDVIGRWSSEEFILLLPDTGPHEAFSLAEQLRDEISQLPPVQRALQLTLTASLGVSFTATHRPLAIVAAHAEDALYQAQHDGYNLVRMQLAS